MVKEYFTFQHLFVYYWLMLSLLQVLQYHYEQQQKQSAVMHAASPSQSTGSWHQPSTKANQFSTAPPVLPTLPRAKRSDLTRALQSPFVSVPGFHLSTSPLPTQSRRNRRVALIRGFHKGVGGYQAPWQIKRQLLVKPRGASAGAPQGCVLPPLWHFCALQLLHKDFSFLCVARCVKIN